MSFFGSLEFVYPGTPPRDSVGDLKKLSKSLIERVGGSDSVLRRANLKFGDRIDQDNVDTEEMQRRKVFGIILGAPREFAWNVNCDRLDEVSDD